ncbi:MAG: hypothetical protein JWP59_3759 [Massilia sp.]|nr:hypothetical protein [Massilia sp.]
MCFALNVFLSNPSSSKADAIRIRQAINNLAIPTDCGVCRTRFMPLVGLHPVLCKGNRPVCPSCAAGAVDVTTPAQRDQNAADLAHFEMLYRAPHYLKCA